MPVRDLPPFFRQVYALPGSMLQRPCSEPPPARSMNGLLTLTYEQCCYCSCLGVWSRFAGCDKSISGYVVILTDRTRYLVKRFWMRSLLAGIPHNTSSAKQSSPRMRPSRVPERNSDLLFSPIPASTNSSYPFRACKISSENCESTNAVVSQGISSFPRQA